MCDEDEPAGDKGSIRNLEEELQVERFKVARLERRVAATQQMMEELQQSVVAEKRRYKSDSRREPFFLCVSQFLLLSYHSSMMSHFLRMILYVIRFMSSCVCGRVSPCVCVCVCSAVLGFCCCC